tara:strand:- start:128 stop:1006 length:879 start_codon:yes stop_codon:yes gene_type:complete
MFNPTQLVIDEFVDKLRDDYERMYGILEPEYPNVIAFVARMALENIANSDALYHDVFHTIGVAEVGQEILRGKHLIEGGVSPRDWLHFVISLMCHDIGYVRGVCRQDQNGQYVIDDDGNTVSLKEGATDAALTPHHVNRGQIFVRERFGHVGLLDAELIARNIENTRFPVPDDSDYKSTDDYPGLLRAADLIGQMADINYLRKGAALFYEFEENGTNQALGYDNPAKLRNSYPQFFWHLVTPYITDALRYLQVTQNGKMWIANLFSHVFSEEHGLSALGPERAQVRAADSDG